MKAQTHYTYIIKCCDQTFYTGYTNDLRKRLVVHNEKKGCKYTRGRTPVKLVYHEVFDSKEMAMKREVEIKNLTRKEKEKLISQSTN